MQTIAQLIPNALARLTNATDSAQILPEPPTPPPLSDEDRQKKSPKWSVKEPLEDKWQAKWLQLEDRGEDVRLMAKEAQAWAFRFYRQSKEGRHILFCGNVGTGKTHTAERLYRYCNAVKIDAMIKNKMNVVPRVEWFQWSDVADLSDDQFRLWKDDRTETQCMFLEDVGAEVDRFKNGIPAERLRRVLEDFRRKFLCITTNVFLDEWSKKWDNRVDDRFYRGESAIVEIKKITSYAKSKAQQG